MKKLSIKLRVTLWYTMLMLLLVMLVLGFMLAISARVVENEAQNKLVTIIDYNAEEVEYDDGELEIDDDDFDFYKEGVYALVYSDSFALISGRLPKGFPVDTVFSDMQVRTVSAGGMRFLTYDRRIIFGRHADVWVRGILPYDEQSNVVGSIIRIAIITLPIIAAFALVGGHWVTRRAFLPVEEIISSADAITEGKDLSLRIDIGEGKDEMHRLADTINGMLHRLEASFESEKQFVADASHELRTPVSVILAQCEFALENSQEDCYEAMHVIQRQAAKMSRLIGQLLAFTRLEQGTEQVRLSHTDLSALVHALSMEQAAIAAKGITVQTDIAEGIVADVDIALFTRLFHNLVQNAFEYGKQNGNVRITLRETADEVALSVADDGIGIAVEDQEKIWRRFYQADSSRATAGTAGMGLGLAMVRQIALLHGGTVCVESALDKGSTFHFRFSKKLA